MKKLPFGFWPVMITAFSSDNRLDLDGVRKLTDMYMQAGANGLFANCLSSEMFQLSNDERLKLTGTVVEHCNGAIPVVATGTFSRNCRENSEFIRKLHGQGATAVVLISSVLVDPGEDDDVLKGRIEEIMENTGEIPLGLYECPEPYKRQISAEMMAWLAGTGRFWYHKDTSCDAGIISSKLDNIRGSQFQLYNADTPSALASLRVGAKGISPISGNFYPELYSHFLKLYQQGEDKQLKSLNTQLTVMDKVTHAFYPYSAKLFLQKRGLPIGTTSRILNGKMSTKDLNILEALFQMHECLMEDYNLNSIV
jgi:4-hydroxy-tetrahydrodipicolinate synthase